MQIGLKILIAIPEKPLSSAETNVVRKELAKEIGINWVDYPVFFRRGAVTVKESYTVHDQYKDEDIERHRWVIDSDTPLFTQNRDYIGGHLKMADDH